MFPSIGSQIFTEAGSRENFHVMEVKNVSRDPLIVTPLEGIARSVRQSLTGVGPGGVEDARLVFDFCAAAAPRP